MSDPKIEPWMVAAVKEVIEAEDEGHLFRTIRNEMEATEGRRAGTDRDATQRTYEALAAIIARHAPDPASVPIGPGDVVQVVQIVPAYASGWHSAFEIGDTLFVCGVEDANALIAKGYGTVRVPFTHLARIGRALRSRVGAGSAVSGGPCGRWLADGLRRCSGSSQTKV